MRLAVAGALSIFLYRALLVWNRDAGITLALLVAGELLTIVIYLFARAPRDVSFSLISVASTVGATFFFVFVVLSGGEQLAPLAVTVSMQAVGIIWQILSKISLGRSFGLLPANRGIVTRGPYRIVRHPIYLGYLVGHVGFLLAQFGVRNLALIAALYALQLIRIREEEKTLSLSEDYRTYKERVRFRLIPGVY